MRMGAIGMKRPEQFPKPFDIYRAAPATSSRGRERQSEPERIGQKKCVLSIAKQEEQLRFSQIGKVITHTIFHAGAAVAKENDMFALIKDGKESRFFRVQTVQNHGEMDVFTTYYCEERSDINGTHSQIVEHTANDSESG